MSMSLILLQLKAALLQVGLVLLMRWLKGDRDSSAVEKKIFETTEKDEMIRIVAGEVIADSLHGAELDSGTEELIIGLLAVEDKEDLTLLIESPQTKTSIADVIEKLIISIFRMFR